MTHWFFGNRSFFVNEKEKKKQRSGYNKKVSTLPETNRLPLKIGFHKKEIHLLKPWIFSCTLCSFEGVFCG